jgi:prevent-host-death family protein
MMVDMTKPSPSFVSTADLRSNCTDTVNRVAYGHERVVLRRRGKAIAAVVPLEDLERLEKMEDAEDNQAANLMARAVKSGKVKTIAISALKTDLDL